MATLPLPLLFSLKKIIIEKSDLWAPTGLCRVDGRVNEAWVVALVQVKTARGNFFSFLRAL